MIGTKHTITNKNMEEKINVLAAREQDKDIKCLCDDCECNGCYDCGECTGYSISKDKE